MPEEPRQEIPRPKLRQTLGALLDRLTTPPVLGWYAVLNLAVLIVVGVLNMHQTVSPIDPEGTRVVTGDYLAFLTGARILAQGQGAALYDLALQKTMQESLAGIALETWQPFVNPPLLAIAMRPLADLPFAAGFRLFAAVTVGAGMLGCLALLGSLGTLRRTRWQGATAAALVLGFHPIATTMLGRQNTTLTLGLLCGALWALQHRHDVLAGLLIGLLSFKPQYMLAVCALLAWQRCWRPLAAAAAVCLLHYGAGALLLSPAWPLDMLAALGRYSPAEWAQSGATHFSLFAFFRYTVGGMPGTVLASLSVLIAILACINFAPAVSPGDRNFPLTWALVIVAGMLASPHLQYYDFGILVLPVAIAVDAMLRADRSPGTTLRVALAVAYLGYAGFSEAGPALGFQPLTLWTVALLYWLCRLGRVASVARGP